MFYKFTWWPIFALIYFLYISMIWILGHSFLFSSLYFSLLFCILTFEYYSIICWQFFFFFPNCFCILVKSTGHILVGVPLYSQTAFLFVLILSSVTYCLNHYRFMVNLDIRWYTPKTFILFYKIVLTLLGPLFSMDILESDLDYKKKSSVTFII